jgi:dihydroflavonol-4-reductase
MKVLVLGATGFIGGHIAKAAVHQGWKVSGLRRRPDAHGHIESLDINWYLGDLYDKDSLIHAMNGMDIVFHAAAFYPQKRNPQSVASHVQQAKQEIDNVVSAAKQVKVGKLIYTSSLTTIGHPPRGQDRLADERDFYDLGTLPNSAYYESKSVMEQYVLHAAKEYLPTVILNPTAVVGPDDKSRGITSILLLVAQGKAIAWIPAKTNIIDVRDVAIAHIQAVEHGRSGERYILGAHNMSINQAFTQAATIYGVRPPRFKIPLWMIDVVVAIGDLIPTLPLPANHLRTIRYWQSYNTQKAKSELNIQPRSFEQTLIDALEWFKDQDLI